MRSTSQLAREILHRHSTGTCCWWGGEMMTDEIMVDLKAEATSGPKREHNAK
jgi:hypothetical protein